MTRTTNARITHVIWLPMAAFEIPLGLWLLLKSVAMPAPRVVPATASSHV